MITAVKGTATFSQTVVVNPKGIVNCNALGSVPWEMPEEPVAEVTVD